MKNFLSNCFLAVVFAGTLFSCGVKDNGDLVGIYSESAEEPEPYGMVFVPRGTFVMGPNDQDVTWSFHAQSKTVDVESFWIDDTEITNAEYRQFIHWVKDSLMRLEAYDFNSPDFEDFAVVDPDLGVLYNDKDETTPRLNYKRKFSRRDKELMYHLDTTFNYNDMEYGSQIKAHKLSYSYSWVDYNQASKEAAKLNPLTGKYADNVTVRKDDWVKNEFGKLENITKSIQLRSRQDFVMKRSINIYPDTLCWIRDFTHAYNEPYMRMYFSHPGYADYPVVGVTWEQATAFCHWRTMYKNKYQQSIGQPTVSAYRLPMESEWEYAARGGRDGAMYPWGGPYTRKATGCFMANFKPNRGSFTDDGHLIPSKVGEYPPNDYNIFDMAGNVAEWTSTAYSPSAMSFVNSMNPDFQYSARHDDAKIMKRKVIRGGSWKDVAYFLQCGVVTYEYQDEARPYIGFRCVRSMVGPTF